MPDKEQEIIKKREIREKRRKILIVCICVALGVFALFWLVTFILSGVSVAVKDENKQDLESYPSYNFYEAKYDYDIFRDDGYLRLNRAIMYDDGMSKTEITDENKKSCPAEIQFMYDVVNLIINGDYEEYNKIFTDDCFKNASEKLKSRFINEDFTMQQLYEIELSYATDSWESNDGNLTYSDIILSYKIRNNNGTFRRDLDANDDGVLPVVYRLVSDSTDTKIWYILTTRQYYSGLYN